MTYMNLVKNYSKASIPILRADKSFTVVEAAFKGYMKWRNGPASDNQRGVSIFSKLVSTEID